MFCYYTKQTTLKQPPAIMRVWMGLQNRQGFNVQQDGSDLVLKFWNFLYSNVLKRLENLSFACLVPLSIPLLALSLTTRVFTSCCDGLILTLHLLLFTGSHKHVLDLMLFLRLPFPQKREISPARQNILNLLLQGVIVVMETWFL